MKEADAGVSQNLRRLAVPEGLDRPVPLPLHLEKGGRIFRLLAARCRNMDLLGRSLAWFLFNFPRLKQERGVSLALHYAVLGKSRLDSAVHRRCLQRDRAIFPLPLGAVSKVQEAATKLALEEFTDPHFAGVDAAEVWTALNVLGVNGLAGFGRAARAGRGTTVQKMGVAAISRSTKRVLQTSVPLDRTCEQAEKSWRAVS